MRRKGKGVRRSVGEDEFECLGGYDITPEHSDNESECGVSDYSDEESLCIFGAPYTIDSLENEDDVDSEDEHDIEPFVSPLSLVFAIIEDEELAKGGSTATEEEHPWYVCSCMLIRVHTLCSWVSCDILIPVCFHLGRA